VARLKKKEKPITEPWRTIRDALLGLSAPSNNGDKPLLPNHVFVPGARVYAKHTGSPLDMPAKTLKAGAHGVPGGENVLVSPDGAIRYFSIRECARLQTFPDDYCFEGTWKTLVRQVGTAVPVAVVERLAGAIREHLCRSESSRAALGA
jgi:DNA (cytosine-5)-methyltransferase 1